MLTMAGLMISNMGFVTTGIVVAINPDNSSIVQVQISESFNDQPALQTGWIPVASPWTGNSFGFFAPPQYNDLVILVFAEADMQNPICGFRVFNDEDVAINVPPGECWMVHKSGTFIKLTNDGNLSLNGEVQINLNSAQVNISCTTQCKINAPSVQIGNTGGTLNKLINDTFINLFNNHIHPVSGASTGVPTVPMTSANATMIAEAN